VFTKEFLSAVPKSDLHCHLDGSLRLETLIELAKERKVQLPSYTPEGLRELVFKDAYRDLPEYLHGFKYTCGVLTDAEALERVAYELGQDAWAEGVCYLEVRFAPQLHVHDKLSMQEVMQAVDRGLGRFRAETDALPDVASGDRPGFRYGMIACAMRMFTAGFGPYFEDLLRVIAHAPAKEIYGYASLELARAAVDMRDRLGLPIVAFDLAGAEAGHPARDHRQAYDHCAEHFMKKTVHAGEAYGAESIFQAITRLNADRIGHGTHLYATELVRDVENPGRFVDQLSQYIADRRITLEVCITSNMQTMPDLRRVEDHPLGRMLDDRLSVTLCTDNRLVSNTTVTRELELATAAFPQITPSVLRNTILHGFKRSFFHGTYRQKRQYVRQVIDYYDRIANEHNVPITPRGKTP